MNVSTKGIKITSCSFNSFKQIYLHIIMSILIIIIIRKIFIIIKSQNNDKVLKLSTKIYVNREIHYHLV